MTNKLISSQLFISIRTTETHRENLMRKLGINTVAGLTTYAIENGFKRLKDKDLSESSNIETPIDQDSSNAHP